MGSKVYFIKASVKDGEQVVSEKARKLFKAGGFARCFREKDFTGRNCGNCGLRYHISTICGLETYA